MMKNILKYTAILIIILSLSNKGSGQTNAGSTKIILGSSHSNEAFVLNKISDKLYSLTFSIDELNLLKKTSPYGNFYQLQIPMASYMGNMEGKPSLPSYAKLLQLPENSSLKIKIDSLITETVSLDSLGGFKVFPFQSSERKNTTSLRIFRYDTLTYNSDFFVGDSLIKLESLGIMRGTSLGRLVINPINYSPVKNILRVVKYFKGLVEIQSSSNLAGNPSKFSSIAFARMMNNKLSLTKSASPLLSKYPMKYVILADSMFKKSIQPFVHWKTEEGFKVIEVYKGATGVGSSPQQMKAYLSNLYFSSTPDDPAPSYLLIVGDNEQLPTFISPRYGHATDLYYATFDGPDDYFPDMFYGRFSAVDSLTLTNQVEKTIEYEKYLFPDPSFLDSAMLISTGNDANGYDYGNGQINYIANNYANPEHGIHSNVFLYPNSYYRSPDVLLHMNNGCSFVNYTGHGDVTFWYSPYLNSTQISNLTNFHKYPLVISNGCITNYFTYSVCFGEALLRGKNIGAIGHIGCTDDSYWDEDYYWAIGIRPVIPNPSYSSTGLGAFDRIFHTHHEPLNEWYSAQGQMSFAGNLAVVESGSRRALYYWEIYTLLGDPSLKVYYGRPDSLTASFPTQLAAGSQQIGIYAEPGCYTGLSLRDSLLDGGAIDSSGFILLNFPSIKSNDTLLIVISKQNRKPILAKITAYSPGQAFLQYSGYSISSESKLANGKADYGESMKLNVHFKNVGGTSSKNIKVSLSSQDSLVTIQDSILLCNALNPNNDTIFSNAFAIRISPLVSDQHEIRLNMDVTDSLGIANRYYLVLTANAPVLEFGEPSYEDKITGNGNARPDPGETLNLVIPIRNAGHSIMDPGTIKISGKSGILSYLDSLLYLPSVVPDSTVWLKLLFHLDASAVPGVPITITAKLDTLSLHLVNNIVIRPAAYSEDFEMGNLKQLPWKSNTALSWYTSDNFPLDGKFSARSAKIGDNQTTDMEIILFVTDTGRVQFQYKVSSEDYYDYFMFYVDNKLRTKVSGQSGSQIFSDSISIGWHSFLWRYQKDEGYSYGDDCVWIDDILFPPSVIIPTKVTHPYYDGNLKTILYPYVDSSYSSAILPSVIIKNSGNLPIEPRRISYQLDSLPVITENLFLYMSPGDTLNYTFYTPLLLPANQSCTLRVNLETSGDSIHSNDTLKVIFRNLYTFIDKHPLSDELKFYPNPAGDFIYYTLSKPVIEGTVEIINIEGKILKSLILIAKPAMGESILDLRELPPGNYFASLLIDGRRYTQKFVKK
jgi:hypothetical protein